MILQTLTITVAVWLITVSSAAPCDVAAPMPTPQELVERAVAIVRVVAVSYSNTQSDLTSTNSLVQGQPIAFSVIETLKGRVVGPNLLVIGSLIDTDDFNERPVPYTFVRPGGRGGNCFALGYRPGASYLLLVNHQQGLLTPYWAPLSPVNEQLRSDTDPWLLWVRRRLSVPR